MKTQERLLAALREARAQLEDVKAEALEPVAVVGMACRFPGSGAGVEAFWDDLRSGADAVREITRWDVDKYYDPAPDSPGKMYVREAALLDRVDEFDPAFFGISPREAASLDPQQRLLLEVTWEALENAAIPPDSLAETRTGVFLGIGQNDYARLATAAGRQNEIGAYDGTGNGFCFAAGRLSYVLGLQGPNLAIDTACSSSLVAVHLAAQSVRRGESDCAIAAGVQLILSPEATLFLSQTKALAPDGRSKPFDASADGYGRGEGCGVVILKRLSNALRDGNPILATIRGSAVNHDGPSSGLTVPNPQAQEALIRAALANAGVRPSEIGYVEAHGTGTILGDPIELKALAAVFHESRTEPLRLGSVKANIGHAEAAAGMAGLIKTILILQHGEIPPCAHFNEPNPRVPWAETCFEIPRTRAPWIAPKRLAGISSFSLSGTNAHIIVEAAPLVAPALTNETVHLLTLSAKSETALSELLARYRRWLDAHPEVILADLCATAASGRTHFSHRWCLVADSIEDVRRALAGDAANVLTGIVPSSRRRPVSFHIPTEEWQHWGIKPVTPISQDGALAIDLHPATADRRTMLTGLAQLYVHGFPIAWKALYPNAHAVLPSYPFERQRYWLEAANTAHPLLERKVQSPLMAQILFEGSVTAGSPAYLADHRIFDDIVVPGAFHLSGLLSAARAVLGDVAIELKDVVFPSALVIRKGEQHQLQLLLQPDPAGGFTFRLISIHGDTWTTHAQGWLGAGASAPETHFLDRSLEPLATGDIYDGLDRRGIHLGPSFRWITEVRAGDGEATCRMHAPDSAPTADTLHPGLIDSCLQLLGAAAANAEGDETFIPFRIERVRYEKRAEGGELWCDARMGASPSNDYRTGDIHLANAARQPILEISGLEVRVHAKPTPLYELAWHATSASAPVAPNGHWLILADAQGISKGAEEFIRKSGASCQVIPADAPLEFGDRRFDGIVQLRGLSADNPAVAEENACAPILALARTQTHPCNCLLFTRGAHAVAGSAIDPLQGFLWGLQPVLRREHPGWAPVVVDLDPAEQVIDWSRIFAQAHVDDQFAVRGNDTWVPRIVACTVTPRPIPIAPHRAYLITGGFGALALRTAAWLAANSATHLVLVGRREAGVAALEAIARMRDTGIEVHTIIADITDAGAVESLMHQIAATLPPLAGIIHAAGVLDDQLLARSSWNEFKAVLAPKVQGAWNLHEQTLGLSLDFFVCFSSIASLIASPGQGAYAAANAFLDGLMRFRRHGGLPGLSLNWGPWDDDGMAARTKQRRSWEPAGINLLRPDDALRMLASALGYSGAQLAAFDFRRLANSLADVPPILAELATRRAVAPVTSNRRDELLERLSASEMPERGTLLDEYLCEQIGKVLGSHTSFRDTGESLTALGIDSLMALELRTAIGTELGKDLPIVRFLDGSTIPDLSALLAAQFTAELAPASWVEGEI